ncbi:MAG: 30S ribosome-binding factor RbfA [Deltaproteobacteria bacterium]|nr:30S ribosome-binding factor RbfA [Deltaproteobacteria bacterium]
MKTHLRANRVAELIQRKIAGILIKKISDPRLCSATITAVKMTADLKIAKIYFTTSENFKKKEILKAFNKASGFIKRNLAKHIETRYMPELRFYYDETFEYSRHIEKILKNLTPETYKNDDT